MQHPLTNILIKIFARGFYKVNSGLLIFLFVVIISYCFFVNTLGDVKLLPPGEELYYHFMILMAFVSSPAMMLMFFTAWLFYTVKSWQFVSGQIRIEHHEFLYYSVLSAGKARQFKSWFWTQFIISLPFVVYTVLASVVGIVFRHYIMVAIILSFTVALIAVTAFMYTNQLNRLIHEQRRSTMLTLGQSWKKPFFSLFIYHVFDRLKLAFVLSKLLSYVAIISILYSFADSWSDGRVAAFAVLSIVMAHAILIYRQHHFSLVYLPITRNLPYSLSWLYLQQGITWLLLLSPECAWILLSFHITQALALLVLMISITMLFNSMLYRIGLAMNTYLPWLFGLFVGMWVLILFGLSWVLAPVCLMGSFGLFYYNYYKEELI